MKTVTGIVNSAKPITLSKATTLLSGFASSENESAQDVSAYLRRASAAFTELRSVHREIRSTNPKSELGGSKGIVDLVENETATGEESVHGHKKKKRKENKEDVMVKLEDEQKNKEENVIDEKVNVKLEEERKEKKKKSKKNKKEDVIDEELEEEQRNEERKERKSDGKEQEKEEIKGD